MSAMAKDTSTALTNDPHYVPVPRRTLWRRIWRLSMRTLALLFVKSEVTGRVNFPRSGPVILVANHNAFLEIAMIIGYAPYQLEFLTTGDIPLEPRFKFWADLYGYIPVKRGSMDRKAMQKALNVLQQGGVIMLFPQGGIWETKVTQAHTGVAWLSQKGNAPVVPIGFGGTGGSFAKAVRLQRPRISMNVGEVLDPCPVKLDGLSRKDTLDHYTEQVMQSVYDLIPDWEKSQWKSLADESFDLLLHFDNRSGHSPNGSAPVIANKTAVSKFFHRPRLLDAMRRNLKLPVDSLEKLQTERDPLAFADALDAAVHYVTEDNPYFLTYRFGNEEGKRMEQGLVELRDAAYWANEQGYQLHIQPVRRFRMEGESTVTEHHYPLPVEDL